MTTRAGDGMRLAVGTLTAVPVPPPSRVDRRTAGWAVALAPVAAAPLGVLCGAVTWATTETLPHAAVGLLVVAALALGTRALHADGLSDVADGLTASYDAQRSLQVMKSGTSGPAGTVALVVVLGLQAVGVAQVVLVVNDRLTAAVVVGVLVCLSRWALLVTCVAPGARESGLGAPFAGCVRPWAAVLGALVMVAATSAVGLSVPDLDDGLGNRGALSGIAALVVVAVVTWRAVRRLGGTTGDVHGAGIELALAVLLIGMPTVDLTLVFAG